MTRSLDLGDVLYLAARLGEPTPRDVGLVESAVARPRTEDPAYDLVIAVAVGESDVLEIASGLADWVHERPDGLSLVGGLTPVDDQRSHQH